ncbi:uncharacterized protein LOC111327815 isoform X2 [Stylophora pistillata]|uniref:uncharacterized protein LOC111327815 isoform X2 n=1 Tax=Stylophora pistillata TaxID=50429 RepID=UPI000C047F70|nr:uncharacterized protein LOC111327815 isoform X2 [Stylophora pistillata]XP_022787836.1 uncharacterized protein LOC111327815 isoform X2 [Stylophora pistillata]
MEGSKLFLILQLWLHSNIILACKEPCLYFSVGNTINSIKLSAGPTTSTVVVQDIGRVSAIAVDVEDNYIYWSDFGVRIIKRMNLQTNKKENVTESVGMVEGIAIDWIDKDIFWTDTTNNRIEMAKVDGSDRKILFDRGIDRPRGIAVDFVNGYIFWTEWGSNPKIERATLDGKERVTIVEASSSSPLKWVNGVIVDYADPESVIYWVDAGLGVVGRADLDGRNRKLSKNITNSILFAIALHNGTLYLSDKKAKTIRLVEKKSLEYLGKLGLSFPEILGITALDGSRQPLIDLVAVSITLEMKMEEWEEEKFKQAVVKGIRDYCYEDACSYNSRNTTIAGKLCSTFPNDSNAGSVQIRVLKKPGEFLVLNQTKVVFSLILQTQSNSTRSVVKNNTLDYVVQKSVYYISKHLGGYKVVYVNSKPPSFEQFCDVTGNKENRNEKTIASIIAGISSGIILWVVIVIAGKKIRRRRRGNQEAQGRDSEEAGREQENPYEEIPDVAVDTRNGNPNDNRTNHIGVTEQPQANNFEVENQINSGNEEINLNNFIKGHKNTGNRGKKSTNFTLGCWKNKNLEKSNEIHVNPSNKKTDGQWFGGINKNDDGKEKHMSTPSPFPDTKRGAGDGGGLNNSGYACNA